MTAIRSMCTSFSSSSTCWIEANMFIRKVLVSCAEHVLIWTPQRTERHIWCVLNNILGKISKKVQHLDFKAKHLWVAQHFYLLNNRIKSISCTAQVIQVGASLSASTSSSKSSSSSSNSSIHMIEHCHSIQKYYKSAIHQEDTLYKTQKGMWVKLTQILHVHLSSIDSFWLSWYLFFHLGCFFSF